MNFHAPVPYRGYETALSENYARVRARLVGLPMVRPAEIPAAPVLLLPVLAERHVVADPILNQRRRADVDVERIGEDVEIIAARRALAIFARLREEQPTSNSARQLQAAVAQAFKVDRWAILGRSRRPGITRIRQIAMTLAMRACHLSRNQIALRFDRNHSTVIHAEKKFAAFLDGATSTIGGV